MAVLIGLSLLLDYFQKCDTLFLKDVDAPIPYAFSQVGLGVVKWIIAVGSIFGLCTR